MIEFDLKMIDEEAFETNYSDAKAYYHRAIQFQAEKMRPSLVFNIASVALERYLVALCDLYGEDARNHNYITLMKVVGTLIAIPEDLNRNIKALDWIFGICSIDDFRHTNPGESDMYNVLSLCIKVENLFDRERINALKRAMATQEAVIELS